MAAKATIKDQRLISDLQNVPLILCDRVLQIWLHLEEGRGEATIGVVTRVAAAGIVEADCQGVWLPDGRFEQWQNGPLDHIELDILANRAKSRLTRISHFADERSPKFFSTTARSAGTTDAAARDCAVVCSLALQHGVPLQTIRHALLRDEYGAASFPLGVALDLLN